MKTFQLENKQSALEIALEKGIITRLEGNGRNLCADNTYPLFVLSVIAENYENKKIPSFDCAFVGVEEKEGAYYLTYSYH